MQGILQFLLKKGTKKARQSKRASVIDLKVSLPERKIASSVLRQRSFPEFHRNRSFCLKVVALIFIFGAAKYDLSRFVI